MLGAVPWIAELSVWHAIVISFAVLGELLAIVFVYRVLVRGGSPASTLLWVAVILSAPWLGLLLYYLLPRRLQLRRLKRMRARGQRLQAVRGAEVGKGGDGAAGRGGRELRGALGALLDADVGISEGNTLRWLAGGEEFFAAARTAIERAQRSVHCVVYILRPDDTGRRFLACLTAAARRGVQVRLCFDSFGSFGLRTAHLAELRAAGGRAEPFLPILWKRRPFTVNLRNHRKLLVIDSEVGFVGGRNIADEYRLDRVGNLRRWFDAMLELRGPVVQQLQELFVQDWCTATDEVIADVAPPAPAPPVPEPGASRVAVVGSGPDQESPSLLFALVQAITDAQSEIVLHSPYLVLPAVLRFSLELAVARGVLVSVYTNGARAEAAFLYQAQRHHYRELLRAGIAVYETIDEYNHAKLLVVDERTVLVGSANMDLRSA
ncbi:MAG TPA: hypothetical protein ENI87_03705, partial [bacterium]|nr:hypothetical protein [bacterium]